MEEGKAEAGPRVRFTLGYGAKRWRRRWKNKGGPDQIVSFFVPGRRDESWELL